MAGYLVALLAAGVGETRAQFIITRGGAGLGYGGWNRTQPGSRGTVYQPVLRQPGMSRFATRSSQSPLDLSYVSGGGSTRTGVGVQAPPLGGAERFRGEDPYLAALSRSSTIASRGRSAPTIDRSTIAGRLAAKSAPPAGVRGVRYDLTRYMSRGDRSAVRQYAARLAEERELDAAALAALRRTERPDPDRGPSALSAASAKEPVSAPSRPARAEPGATGPSTGTSLPMAPVPVERSPRRANSAGAAEKTVAPARDPLSDFATPPAPIRQEASDATGAAPAAPSSAPRRLTPAAADPSRRPLGRTGGGTGSTSRKPPFDGSLPRSPEPATSKGGPGSTTGGPAGGPGRLQPLPAAPPAMDEPEMKPIPVIPD